MVEMEKSFLKDFGILRNIMFIFVTTEVIYDRSTRSQMFFKIVALKDFTIFATKQLCWSLFFVAGLQVPTWVFSCEYCEIFKNNYFEELLRTGASIASDINLLNSLCV